MSGTALPSDELAVFESLERYVMVHGGAERHDLLIDIGKARRLLNHARSCLRDAEDESTNGLTANPRFIDQRVTEAREAIEKVLR